MAASSVMFERNFWVNWLLDLLFADADLATPLVFSGFDYQAMGYRMIPSASGLFDPDDRRACEVHTADYRSVTFSLTSGRSTLKMTGR
jgi:hypothetical protein